MSGTSNVSSLSKGSTLSYDAPAFIPSFMGNSAIKIQRPSASPSSTPPTRAATPVTVSSLPPPVGQVLQGGLSLEQPFDELCYKTFCAHEDPTGVLKSEARYIRNNYLRHHAPTKPGKVRPVIYAPVPSWATGEARRLVYVFAMGTFEGHTDDTLPVSLKRFAIPVVTLRSNAKIANSPNSIRITPTWNLPDKECCWIIAIPVGLPLSEAPTKKWRGAVKGYSLEPEEMKKLVSVSDQRLEEFEAMAQNTESFKEYFTKFRTSRFERPEKAPSATVTNAKVVVPNTNFLTSSSKPPTLSPPSSSIKISTPSSTSPTPRPKNIEIVSEVKAMCWVSKRGREEDRSLAQSSYSAFDSRSQQPARASKRLCVKKGTWKKDA